MSDLFVTLHFLFSHTTAQFSWFSKTNVVLILIANQYEFHRWCFISTGGSVLRDIESVLKGIGPDPVAYM